MMRDARVSLRASLVAALVGLGTACAEGGDQGQLLPATTVALVPTGDRAGGAERGAERVRNPYAGDAAARAEGERLFRQMNCADCHGYEGKGGMGPSLVDGEWLFGPTPVDKFTSVHGGRARGMPSYGHLLPDASIWKVVAYLDELERAGGERRRAGGGAAGATRRAQQPQAGRH